MLDSLIKNMSTDTDIYSLSKKVCKYFCDAFEADLCSIYIKDSEETLNRLHLSFGDFEGDSIDVMFPYITLPIRKSVAGNTILSKKISSFISNSKLSLEKKLQDDIRINNLSIEPIENVNINLLKYNKRSILNYIFIPANNSEENKGNTSLSPFDIDLCFSLINIKKGSQDQLAFDAVTDEISRYIEIIKAYFFNSLYFSYAREEIEINRFIKKLEFKDLPLDNMIDEISDNFSYRLKSTHTHIWYYDKEFEVFGLQSIKVYNVNNYTNSEIIQSKEILSEIDSRNLRVLRSDQSLIGKMISKKLKYLKVSDLDKEESFRWKSLLNMIPTKKFIAFPLFGSNFIGVMCFHPNMNQYSYERLSTSFYRKFLDQSRLLFKFLESKKIQQVNHDIFKKLRDESNKNPQNIYRELLYKIQSIIGSESCSLYLVKSKNIFITESTSKAFTKGRKYEKKICEIDDSCIVSYCAKNRQPLRIFDVKNINSIYPKIHYHPNDIFECNDNQKNVSLLLVPFYRETRDDGAWFIIKVVNKLNKIGSNPIGVTEFSNFDVDIVSYIGSIIENYFEIFDSIRDRNSLVELLLHEIKMPLKVIKNKNRKIENLITSERHNLIRFPIKDIYDNLDISKRWLDNVETINTLFQDKNIITKPKSVRLIDVVKNSIHWQRPQLYSMNMRPEEILEDVVISRGLFVNCDESHLYQIISNIIANALKYRKEGFKPKIKIWSERNGSEIELYIQDSGIGVAKSDVEKIFNIRYRSAFVRSKNYKGQGYGLWLSRKLALANKCSVRLESFKDPTIFVLKLKSKGR